MTIEIHHDVDEFYGFAFWIGEPSQPALAIVAAFDEDDSRAKTLAEHIAEWLRDHPAT